MTRVWLGGRVVVIGLVCGFVSLALGAQPAQAAPQAGQQEHDHGPGSENRERYRAEPRRVDEGPSIDGVLDESVWQAATLIDCPGSDLYVVYDELKADMPLLPEVRNRQLVVKMTYLLSR